MIIHHPKVIISPQKCPFFPQKPHLFNIFTLKNDLRTFVENCRESHLRDIMGQIAQDAWIRGWGVNLIQAMPEFWEHLVLAPLPYLKESPKSLDICQDVESPIRDKRDNK